MAPNCHGQGHCFGHQLSRNILEEGGGNTEEEEGMRKETNDDKKQSVRKRYSIYGFVSASCMGLQTHTYIATFHICDTFRFIPVVTLLFMYIH